MTYNVARYCQIFSDFAKYCPILCNIVQNCQILPNIFQYSSNGYFSSLYSELVSIHYLLPVTCHLLLGNSYLLLVTCLLLLNKCYLLHVTCCMLLIVIWYLQSDFSIWSWVIWSLLFLAKKLLPFAPVVRLALVFCTFYTCFFWTPHKTNKRESHYRSERKQFYCKE